MGEMVDGALDRRSVVAVARQGQRVDEPIEVDRRSGVLGGVGGRVGIADYQNLGEYLGWSPVVFPFAR